MLLTLNQAKQHLASLRRLAIIENQYLSCVHTYLRSVEIDVLANVRADQFASHDAIADLIDEINRTSRQVDNYLRGSL